MDKDDNDKILESVLVTTESPAAASNSDAERPSFKADRANTKDQTAKPSSLAHRATGPRTQQGKRRSRYNAVTHGLSSKLILLPDESQAEFDALRKGLWKDRKPVGRLEELLVETLAVLFWLRPRGWIAVAGEIQAERNFLEWDRNERDRQDASRYPQLRCNGGLVRWIANSEALQGCLNLLQELKESIEQDGFNPAPDKSILRKLYGNH